MTPSRLVPVVTSFVLALSLVGCGSSSDGSNGGGDDGGLGDAASKDDAKDDARDDAKVNADADGASEVGDGSLIGAACGGSLPACPSGWVCEADSDGIGEQPQSCRKKLTTCLPDPCGPGAVCIDVVVVGGGHPYSYCAKVVGAGAKCGVCDVGLTCLRGSAGDATCVADLPPKAACGADSPNCVSGYGCLQTVATSLDRTCQAQHPEGGSCLDDRSCVDGTYCGDAHLCVHRGGTGDPCKPSTISLQCQAHYWCETSSATCQPLPPAKL